jgi:uncharacterized membrane protein
MLKKLRSLFFKGLITVLPITLSVYLIYILGTKAENLMAGFVKGALGPGVYVPGLGIILTVVVMILVGVLVSNIITGSIIRWLSKTIEHIPFIKAIYNPLRDLMQLFVGSSQSEMKKVVMVDVPQMGGSVIGLVTRDHFGDIGLQKELGNKVAVYVPFSYMLGGLTVLVDRDKMVEVDIPVDKALKLGVTAWIKVRDRA